jgi:hypothetical protein
MKRSGGQPKPSRLSAADRLLAITPMLEQNRQRELRIGRKKRLTLSPIVSKIAREQRVSTITIWRWYMKFQAAGYAALVRTRSDRGGLRYISSHPEIAVMIESRMSRGRAPFSIWKSLCLDLGDDAPGYHIVLGYVQRQREARRSSSRRSKGMAE